jgi:hypothetical protein
MSVVRKKADLGPRHTSGLVGHIVGFRFQRRAAQEGVARGLEMLPK